MKKSKSRKLSLIVPFLVIFLISCTHTNYVKVMMEIPQKPDINISPYQDILITNFLELESEEIKDFDANQEIQEYFSFELKKHLKKNTKITDITIEQEEEFKDPDRWKNVDSGENKSALFTGSVKYSEETRKSLKKKEKRRFDDPFPEESRIETRTFYALELHLYLIDTQTGEIIYDKNYKQNKSYENPNQTAHFAFFDLLLEVRDNLLEDLKGYERMKERYLLIK
ncbi:hypothetical protein JW879_05055 [candidate division WOR-3 bacterium]|nr:hypothetical protein [candidate division WOR-3 bacterium]